MRFLVAAIALLFPLAGAVEEIPLRGIAWTALSPDGKSLAFECLNDIWLAPSSGGEAVRVMKTPVREAYPLFSPDGGRIYFGSEVSGSVQLHSVKLDGSDLRIHTEHSEGSVPGAISADGSFAIVRGTRDSSGYEPNRLIKVNLATDARELELFDATAHSVSISPDGKRFLFCRGGEQLYRPGYRGSRASSIHLYDSSKNRFISILSEDSDARSPLWKPDGNGFYYVSSKEGSFDVWEGNFTGKKHRRLTSMRNGGVVLPTLSADGKVMVFRSGQEVYRFEPEGTESPVAVRFYTKEKLPDRSLRKERVTGTSFATFSEDGERTVFSSAGDLWTMAAGESSPQRMTATDETDEREPAVSADGKAILFLRDDGLKAEVCRAEWEKGKLGEVGVIATSEKSKHSLKVSPCGRRLSWLEETGNLVIATIDGGAAKVVAEAWDTPTYDWSPDGEWLVISAKDIHSNRDIFLVHADGSETPRNLTQHPAFEGSPKFSPDGKFIVFTARREPDEIARLWLLDFGIDLEKVTASLRPLQTNIGEPTRVTWAADSSSVLFQSRDASDKTIYSVQLDGGEVSSFADFRGIAEGTGADGRSFWRIDRVPSVFHAGKMTRFEFSISVEQERSKRLRLGFRRIWRTLGERFYDETMNGKDWPAILAKYEDAAAEAMDSRQFDRVVAQLLGELNASHLTFKTSPWGVPSEPDTLEKPSAFPGLTFRNSWDGSLLIEKVLEGSPISLVDDAPIPGETLLRIGGKEVDARTPLHTIFNGAKGSVFPIVIASKVGVERTLELIPISYGRARWLDRSARLKRAELAAQACGKKIAYLPFRKMNSDDLRELSTEVYRASLDAEGLILDLRDNVGGRLADQLLGLFCQPVHTFTIPRGGERGYPSDRRVCPAWDGPMVVLCNENTYSNAEIFCHAFKRLGRGKLVGVPTNGGVISAVTARIPEVGELQIPFRGWFQADTGRDLELNGALPDVVVPIDPKEQANDLDPQLKAALRALNETIAAKGAEIPAILKLSE